MDFKVRHPSDLVFQAVGNPMLGPILGMIIMTIVPDNLKLYSVTKKTMSLWVSQGPLLLAQTVDTN